MDIALKYKIIEKIMQSNDDTLIDEIESLLGFSDGDFWGDLPSEVKKAIDKAKCMLDSNNDIH